ncbi:hypothetical protein C9F11_37665 [Streptomyces sp. YIM 121038]|uniref:hypothetical protein n=1 Tax=Streptomyces sp. YIM 121038 TaxID=2136401 RepID=UPI00111072C8|nr:hypothetical protein [Streptomyces sp. YIM 121038]QCX81116.1 hypothetical protein C9F11_37665 [Streptomyces sp. YIM 121038]
MTESSKPQLSFSLRSDWLAAYLRVDQIRHDTLVGLVAAWSDPDARDDVLAQLDALAETVASPREGELDALVEQVEGAAGMDDAQVEVRLDDALRLRAELDAVIAKLGRFNPDRVERPKGASDIKHPTMRATRKYLAAHPLPEQDGRRTA